MRTLLILFIVPFLFSFKFNPMSQTLDLSEGKKSAQFTVENDTPQSLAIELTVKERKMDINGKEELPPSSEVSIFPPQIIIPSKEKRTIRVTWTGGELKSEKAFRVVAEQLPLNVDEKTKKSTGIQMLMKYMAAFYVSPGNVEPKLSASVEDLKNGKLSVKVTNSGTEHQILVKPKLTFKKGNKKWVLEEKDLTGLAGENVLAQSERIFTLSGKTDIPKDAEVNVKLEK